MGESAAISILTLVLFVSEIFAQTATISSVRFYRTDTQAQFGSSIGTSATVDLRDYPQFTLVAFGTNVCVMGWVVNGGSAIEDQGTRFSIAGETGSNYNAWNVDVGTYDISIYPARDCSNPYGTLGTTKTFTLSVIRTTPTTKALTTKPLTTSPLTTKAVSTAALTTKPLTTAISLTTKPLTTKAVSTAALTTKPLTTAELTTKPLTTAELTTKPLTTKALTTKPLTTAGLTTGALTSGEVTTASITSGVVTTGSVTSNCTRQCWNGDCVAQLSDCPVMPPCEDMTRRCDNQTCVLFEEVCEQPTCLPGETVCADGQCVSSPSLCSSYNGCPFGQFMCPDGLCADEVSECLCVNEGQYRCVDGSCDENPADCGEVPYTVKPQETTFYVNLSSTHDEDFVLPILDSETHQKLCTIIFPKISSDLRLQVFVHGVPDSDLRSYASIDVRNILSAVISLDIQITDANGDVVPIESLSDEVIQFSCDVAHHQNIDENAICLYTFGEDAESAECKEAAAKNIGEGSLRISNRASFAFLLGSEDDSSASSSEEAFRKSYVVIAVGVSLGLAVVGVIAVVIYMKKRRRGVLNATGSRASRSKSFSMPSSRLNTLSLAAVIPMRPKSQVDPEMGSRPSSTLGDNTSRPPSTVETA
eukprot:TRINITY_DN1944_c0_g1_i5.p1 TRINITY_DN1944_c0_g1~~TRINITY_DN1944_c0_g1_i5.p1  ORF type:complete len:675 (-),score=118.85 TRINITY_DN1944_c0_g1_i5:523-2460(-)